MGGGSIGFVTRDLEDIMKPNIDRKGRIARAISGTLCIAAGIAFWWFGWPESPTWRWVLAIVCTLAGAFQLFEARRGWCVARACGIRTPM